MKNQILITKSGRKTVINRNGCKVIYDGGEPERQWWRHCDKEGIPFVMAYRVSKYWGVKWDDITLQMQNLHVKTDEQFYSDMEVIHKKFWKLKTREPWGYSTVGRFTRLTYNEAVDCAGMIYQALTRCVCKRDIK